MTRTLGISAYYHDSAAALVENGRVIKAVQEERFTRLKNDPAFPEHALLYCLEGLRHTDIDAVVFYEKPFLKFERLLETYLAFAPSGFSQFRRSMPIWLKEKLFQKQVLRKELARVMACEADEVPRLLFTQHHQAHAASAFYPSPFRRAAVLCIDGVGEWSTTSAWLGDGATLAPLWQINFPHSLGLLYSAFTYYCGFEVNNGEYKLMGLAPYGEPRYVDHIKDSLIDIKEDGSFRLNLDFFDYCTGDRMINDQFRQLFESGERPPDEEIEQRHMDIAASIQQVAEEVTRKLAVALQKETGAANLCLAGGVALNCVANGHLRRAGCFQDIWVQPAAGDAGGAVGAALVSAYKDMDNMEDRSPEASDGMSGCYLGPDYPKEDIRAALESFGLSHEVFPGEEIYEEIAACLDAGLVVGWFQGRSEFGPRALGARSILGDPRQESMQRKLNLKIKNRESFRPFAPVVRVEDVAEYFDCDQASPYMSFVEPIKASIRETPVGSEQGLQRVNQRRSQIPAVTHVNYSARLQTVDKARNPGLYRLLTVFRELTGCGVLINTSFNVRDEPIVETPADACRCFLATGMDVLVLGNHLVRKGRATDE